MVKCSVCGRELSGVELMVPTNIPWKCAECSDHPEDSIYCREGDRVKFAFPDNGTQSCQIMANKYLTVGNIYTVDGIKIGKSSSHIKLVEFPYWFNTVLFERM